MIIAIASEEGKVAQHFGRCPEYTIVSLADKTISKKEIIPNPGHEPGFLPGYLGRMGVSVVIAGGMGPRAQALFNDENIKSYVGVTGDVDEVIKTYLAGNLQSGISSCEHESQ